MLTALTRTAQLPQRRAIQTSSCKVFTTYGCWVFSQCLTSEARTIVPSRTLKTQQAWKRVVLILDKPDKNLINLNKNHPFDFQKPRYEMMQIILQTSILDLTWKGNSPEEVFKGFEVF